MRWAAYALFAAVLGVALAWLVQGRSLVTLTQTMVTERVVDEFGDVVDRTRWEPALRIGLLDVTLPAAGVLGGAGAFLLWRARRRRRQG